MVAGAITIFVWKFLVRPHFNIYELLPAFIVCCIVIVVVSLLTKEPEKEITDDFDAVKVSLNA